MGIPLILASGLLLSACAPYQTQGRFINLETGSEVLVAAQAGRDGRLLLEGSRAGGDTVRGELWEVRAIGAQTERGESSAHPPGDTVYQGTGFLRDGDWVLDFDYRRLKESSTALGTATDNRGARYKAIFRRKTIFRWMRGPESPADAGP
jgi:hypothetical protein